VIRFWLVKTLDTEMWPLNIATMWEMGPISVPGHGVVFWPEIGPRSMRLKMGL